MGVSSLLIDAPLLPASAAGNNTSPVATYLGRLGPGSRRGQMGALNTIARLLTRGSADAQSIDWASVKYPQTAAIRVALSGRYAPNTTKRMLAALRGVLKECWRLGLIVHDEYARACGHCPCSWTIAPSRSGTEGSRTRSIVQGLPSRPDQCWCS